MSILILVALSAYGTLRLVAHINQIEQKQQIMGGIVLLAADQISVDGGDVSFASEQLGMPMSLLALHKSSLTPVQQARILNGERLILDQGDGSEAIYMVLAVNGTPHVLKAIFSDFRSSHVSGATLLLRHFLQRRDQSMPDIFAHYSRRYAIPLRVLSAQQVAEFKFNRAHMTAPNHIARFDLDGSSARYYTYMPELEEFIEMGPMVFRQELSLQSLVVVILLSIILTGIAVYWLVHGFELNLQRLERASSRIASGHLNSRVKVPNEDAFSRLGQAFNRMAQQIQSLMGGQKEMIRAVSHELRTPVARMRFGVQMLEDSTQDSYLQKQLHDMDQDLQELDELVDEILTYAKLEEGGPVLDFRSANMLDLVDQVVEETKRRTDQVTIHWDSEATQENKIFSDVEYRYMHRAIQNLVGNACRYAKTQVHVHYSMQGDICRIDVEDDGEGIPEKDWDRIFSPFTRLDDSRTRASGGYGLGLSIVRRIIYWHGGKALVNRSRWGGAKMSLLWPQSRHLDQN